MIRLTWSRLFACIWMSVAVGIVMGGCTVRVFGQPRIPATAAAIAAADAEARRSPAMLYVWCPAASKAEHATVAAIANYVLSRVAEDVRPILLANGAIAAIDLAACANDEQELAELLSLRVKLASADPYFTIHSVTTTEVIEACAPFVQDGKTWKAKRVVRTVTVNTPAPYLGEAGVALQALCGEGAITHVGYLARRLLTSRDDGLYYEARGLQVGKTKLNDYLRDRGVDLSVIDRLRSEDAEHCMSQVTGRARQVRFRNSSGVKPSVGSALCAVTMDNFEDRTDSRNDPFRSLLDHKPDGYEVFVTLPSGWIEYTLFDGNNLLAAEAPPNLVTDRTVPNPFPARLSPPISCIRCHGPHDQWQPMRQEFKELASDRTKLLTDLSKGQRFDKQLEQFRRVQAITAGDTDRALELARNTADARSFAVCKLPSQDFSAAVSRVYGDYVFRFVTPLDALAELGFTPDQDDPTGVLTFRRVVPARSEQGLTPDDPSIARLHTLALGRDGKRTPLTLTRLQWEQVYADAMTRAIPAHEQAAKDLAKQGFDVRNKELLR